MTTERLKPFVRCKFYDLARKPDCPTKHLFVTERPNGELESRGCQDCNGYNTRCEVYKEWYLKNA